MSFLKSMKDGFSEYLKGKTFTNAADLRRVKRYYDRGFTDGYQAFKSEQIRIVEHNTVCDLDPITLKITKNIKAGESYKICASCINQLRG